MTLRRAKPYWSGKGNGGFEPEYQAVLNRASFLGYTTPDSTTNNRNNARVKNLKDTGIWDKLDLLYMFDQPTGLANFSKINYISPSNFEVFNSNPSLEPDFVADSGFKGDGSTKWFDTGFNLLSDKVQGSDTSFSTFYRGFDFLDDSDVETISTMTSGTTSKDYVNLKLNATSSLFRCQSSNTFSFPGTDHNKTILISSTGPSGGGRCYRDGVSSNSLNSMSGNGFENGTIPLFAAKTLPSTISNYMKSGLMFYGIGADLGVSNPNSLSIDLHEIMTDTYTP